MKDAEMKVRMGKLGWGSPLLTGGGAAQHLQLGGCSPRIQGEAMIRNRKSFPSSAEHRAVVGTQGEQRGAVSIISPEAKRLCASAPWAADTSAGPHEKQGHHPTYLKHRQLHPSNTPAL